MRLARVSLFCYSVAFDEHIVLLARLTIPQGKYLWFAVGNIILLYRRLTFIDNFFWGSDGC